MNKLIAKWCDECGVSGYPICRFCHPKKFRIWYKEFYGIDYNKDKLKWKLKETKK